MFLRGNRNLCSKMVRTRIKGPPSTTKAKGAAPSSTKAKDASLTTEPNFYNMPPCHDDDDGRTTMMEPYPAVVTGTPLVTANKHSYMDWNSNISFDPDDLFVWNKPLTDRSSECTFHQSMDTAILLPNSRAAP